jgi:murein L,D-transpeptidase YafK
MLKIALSCRFCLVLVLVLSLLACSAKQQEVVQSAGGGSEGTVVTLKKCPEHLFGLRQQQAKGNFLNCFPDKDGTPFKDEQNKFAIPPEHQSVWLLVDTQKLQLEVKRGEKTLAVLPNIAIGRNGAGFKNRRGDDITPLGEYKIGWINDKSPFHTFYGLTYPSVENAKEAFAKKLISENEYNAIIYAHEHQQIPPQNTALGGQVGLHGLGRGDEKIHRLMNWTHGCVALTNSQLQQLDAWVVEGMRVKIK